MIVWVGILAMAFMGFLDDFIKVRKRHNRGIFWKQKNYVTLLMSFGIAWWLVGTTGIAETISLTRAGDLGFDVPTVVWIDLGRAHHLGHDQRRQRHRRARRAGRRLGADGLRRVHDHRLLGVPQPATCTTASSTRSTWPCSRPRSPAPASGFLWWNAAPARIFMGDVGALGIGSALALLALTTNTQLLLLLICGINVMEAGSVALQMGVFKASGRKRRLFRMSPIHHHFELVGWPETTVIIRFWLISAICVATRAGDLHRATSPASGRAEADA